MIEIVEHMANETIRRRNKEKLAAGQNASALITDQKMIMYEGVQIGWLNNHPAKSPGVMLIVRVDDETREEIDRAVEQHLGQSVPIGQPPPDDEEPEEEKPQSKIWTPEGDEGDES